jgi:hypothetical protein
MNLDALNKWLTLVANFGVIGGLVLVAVQMNFNTKTIRLQNDLELNRELAAGELAIMGDSTHIAYANALFHPADLTEAQLGQLWAYLHNALLAAQNNWLAYQNGQASDASWKHARDQAAVHLGSRAAQVYWKYDKFEYQADFVDQIDSKLAESDTLQVEAAWQQMLDEIRSLERNRTTDGPFSTPPPSTRNT